MKNRNILISGAGIAGLTLAYWLKRWGFEPTVIEPFPTIRKGGYMIDFFGEGVDVAEKMNLLAAIKSRDVKIPELSFVDNRGKRKGGLNMAHLRKLLGNRAYHLLRSDLVRILYSKIEREVDFIFGTSIVDIQQTPDSVKVLFSNGKNRNFDLLVGADGLHSGVRELVFGDEKQFEQYLGYYTASYTILNYPDLQRLFLSHTVPGKQVGLYAVDKGKSVAFFLSTSPQKLMYDRHDVQQQKWILQRLFDKVEWICPDILVRMNEADDFYFDEVSQVKMNAWSKGRVTLVGDACNCPSLLSGQGSTLAMVGAYTLAGELKNAGGNFEDAFSEYQNVFGPYMESKQRIAQSFAPSFLPRHWLGIWLRNAFTSKFFLPFFDQWFLKRFLTTNLHLKEYQSLSELIPDWLGNGHSKIPHQIQ